MKPTNRQQELTQFLTSWLTENEIEGSIEFDADWCWWFLMGMNKIVKWGFFTNPNDSAESPANYRNLDETLNITEQLQDSVKQTMIRNPEQSKQVIKEMQ